MSAVGPQLQELRILFLNCDSNLNLKMAWVDYVIGGALSLSYSEWDCFWSWHALDFNVNCIQILFRMDF